MNTRWIVLTIFVFGATACNLPDQATASPLASPTPMTAAPSPTFSTPTLIPLETLLALPTATFAPTAVRTPRLAIASPINQPVNCRFGPSPAYTIVGGLQMGGQAEIVGKNIDVTWWYVKNPSDPSTYCWLSASVIDASGNLAVLPVVAAPLALVTNIQVSVEPASMNISCNSFPQYVTATGAITTNGPATVNWRWETSEGEFFAGEPLLYLEGSSQPVLLYYKVNAAKDYSIQIHILSPNDTTGMTLFKATCVP